MNISNNTLYKSITKTIRKLEKETDLISPSRKKKLMEITNYLIQKTENNQPANLIVICTHNSRRSHLGQLWLATAAHYFNLPDINTYSGGTEATAFNHRAVKAMEKIGFKITTTNEKATNPVYHISWSTNQPPYPAFSKKYDNPPNPLRNFAAIMVCTQADEGCPVVFGSEERWAVSYDDPKAFDNTPQEAEKYDERVLEIGREMTFIMAGVARSIT